MFFDVAGQDPFWERPEPVCKSCRRPIEHGQQSEHVQFAPSPDLTIEAMNGLYHAECAKPFLSIARAIDMLGRRFF